MEFYQCSNCGKIYDKPLHYCDYCQSNVCFNCKKNNNDICMTCLCSNKK